MTSEQGGKVDHGPLSESMYSACRTHLTTGSFACTSSVTREYMEHGGRLPPNCALTVYYLPVYPPYSDYNYGLWGVDSSPQGHLSNLIGRMSLTAAWASNVHILVSCFLYVKLSCYKLWKNMANWRQEISDHFDCNRFNAIVCSLWIRHLRTKN